MTTFWPLSQNKVLLEILICNFLRERSLERHEEPTILSQPCMDNNEWQCIKIHNGAEDNMQQLQSLVEEADLRMPMHVLDCLWAGHKTCVVISNDTDVIVALLFYMPTFLQEGLQELWVRAGRGNTTHFIPLHILYAWLGPLTSTVLPALHGLTGCDVTSEIGTKKAALKAATLWFTCKDLVQQPHFFLHWSSRQNSTWCMSKMLQTSQVTFCNFERISFTFQNQLHTKIYHRHLRDWHLTSIVHSLMHTPPCMFLTGSSTSEQQIWIH